MKIAYLALGEEFGASHAGFVHSYSITNALAKNGLNIKLFIRQSTGRAVNNMSKNIKIIPVTLPSSKEFLHRSPSKYAKSFFQMKREINNMDIIHERFHINPIDLLFVGKRKYVLEVNDPAIALSSSIRKHFILAKFLRCDAMITQTETLKRILEEYTNKRIFVIPNGVDTALFKPNIKTEIRKKYGIKKEDVLIAFVGAFREWHGVEDIPKMAKKMPNAKFLLVGSGPLFHSVHELSKGIDNMILTGEIEYRGIPEILSASDILIAPFNTSGFKQLEELGFWWCPIKLFEYMAAGRPIVSYNFEEVRKIVRNSALLAEPQNLDDFIKKLHILIENKALRKKLGERARGIALAEYDWNERAQEIMGIYRKLLRE